MDKKNKNPNVPTLRFAGYIDNYRTCKLIDISEIITRTNENNSEYPIMMISAGKGFIAQSEKYSRDNAGTSINKYILLKKGELAYNRGNSKQFPYGAIYEMKEEYALIPYVYHCFNIYNGSTRYFSYYLNSPFKDEQLSKIITSSVRGNGLLNISKKDFFNLSLNVPSIKEQNKIANFLDLIENRIQTQIKIIDDYSSVKDYIIKDYFQKCREYIDLGNSFKYGKAGGTPKSSNKEYYDGDIPFLGIADITSQGKYINHTSKSLTQKGLINSSAWLVPKNSLILSMYASVGLPTINKIPLATSQAMMSMIFEDELDVEFVYYYLCYFKKNKIRSLLETGTQSNINADTVKSIKVPKLKADEKERITNIFIKIDQLINNEKQILNLLQKQKNFLLKNMFV